MSFRSLRLNWQRFSASEESGQALVETAVMSTVLVLLLTGVVALGQVIYTQIQVSDAALSGAQYAAQNGVTAQDSAGVTLAAQADGLSTVSATLSQACACYNAPGTAISCGSSSNGKCANSHLIETVTVSTSYSLTPILHVPGFGTSITLTGSATQMCGE